MIRIDSKRNIFREIFYDLFRKINGINFDNILKNPYFYNIYKNSNKLIDLFPISLENIYKSLIGELDQDFSPQIEMELDKRTDLIRYLRVLNELNTTTLLKYIIPMAEVLSRNLNINPKIILKFCNLLDNETYKNTKIDGLLEKIQKNVRNKANIGKIDFNSTKSQVFNYLYYHLIINSITSHKNSPNFGNNEQILTNSFEIINSNNWLDLEFFELISFYKRYNSSKIFKNIKGFSKTINNQITIFFDNYFLNKNTNLGEFLLLWNLILHNSIKIIYYSFDLPPDIQKSQNKKVQNNMEYFIEYDIIEKLPLPLRRTANSINDLIKTQLTEPIPIMLRKLVQNVLTQGLELYYSKKQIPKEIPRRDIKRLIVVVEEEKLISPEIANNLLAIRYLGGIEAHDIFYDANINYVQNDLRNICIFIDIFYNRLDFRVNSVK